MKPERILLPVTPPSPRSSYQALTRLGRRFGLVVNSSGAVKFS
jgi:hypothetical protein